LAIEVVSFVVISASALALIVLERACPYDRGQKFLRDGFWTDLVWYTFLQSYLLAIAIGAVIRWMQGQIPVSRHLLVTDWPLPAQVVFFVITHDFYIYCFHRLQHRSRILWRLHEAHHSVSAVDWLAGSRSHALEILINQTVEFLPMALLGAAPELPIVKGMIDAVWGMYIHANLNVRSGILRYVINGPELHRWHHARETTRGGINFGTKLAIWDWMFGTASLPSAKPSGYGLGGDAFPCGYFAQQGYAFRRFRVAR
jgi:sterol desaturase/sphingolipid hydroxylase (fatty acid hydroxylase superfamily)